MRDENTSNTRPAYEGITASMLVVDDEKAIADLVGSIFESEGMDVSVFYDPERALASFESRQYDIAIIDIMMPRIDGFELCQLIRKIDDVPVVFLSAKDAESDIVAGFVLGAEDYVTKPFKPRELVARVKARLRRSLEYTESRNEGILSAQGIDLDPATHDAALHDVPLRLTPKEFAILEQLMRHKGRPVPTRKLYEQAWGEPANASSSNTVMVHIRHLRQKLAEIDSSKELIETAWGVGYRVPAEDVRGKKPDAGCTEPSDG